MAKITLEDVSKVFPNGVTALQGLSLEVQDDELLVIVGPSGSGKSTTLRLIAGLETVSSGTIRLGDRDVTQTPPRDRDIAWMSQSPALYPHLSVLKNLTFGWRTRNGLLFSVSRVWKRLFSSDRQEGSERQKSEQVKQGFGRSEIDARVRQAMQVLGIEHLQNRRPWQLSGGERQRVALGRILVRPVLMGSMAASLLDEPLSNLDPQCRSELRWEIKTVQRQSGTAMMYVTHDQAEALSLADRIAVLDGGRLQQIGSPQELYDRPTNRFVATFLGEPAMNLIAGRLRGERDRVWLEVGSQNEHWKVDVTQVVEKDSIAGVAAKKSDVHENDLNLEVEWGVRPAAVQIASGAARFENRFEEESSGQDVSGEKARSGRIGCQTIPAVVSSVEFQGDGLLVTAELVGTGRVGPGIVGGDGQTNHSRAAKIVVKAGSGTNIRPGDEVRVLIDVLRTHVFDRQTGKNLK